VHLSWLYIVDDVLCSFSHLLVLSSILGGSFLHGTILLWVTIFVDPSQVQEMTVAVKTLSIMLV